MIRENVKSWNQNNEQENFNGEIEVNDNVES